MTLDRAIEILDPEHREHYESIDPVNEACRIGMNALKQIRDGKLVEVVYCRECMFSHKITYDTGDVVGLLCSLYGDENDEDAYCSKEVWDGKTGL